MSIKQTAPPPPRPTLPVLTEQNQDGWTKPKSNEKYTPFVHCILSFEGKHEMIEFNEFSVLLLELNLPNYSLAIGSKNIISFYSNG